jgi:hypothetical protein
VGAWRARCKDSGEVYGNLSLKSISLLLTTLFLVAVDDSLRTKTSLHRKAEQGTEIELKFARSLSLIVAI